MAHAFENETVGYKQLWVYKNKDGKNTMRIVEYIHDTDKNDRVRYKTLKNFSGTLLFRDWDNKFLYGMRVKNNKFVGAFDELIKYENGIPVNPSKNDTKKAKVGGYVCEWTDSYNIVTITVTGHPEIYFSYIEHTSSFSCFFVSQNDMAPP